MTDILADEFLSVFLSASPDKREKAFKILKGQVETQKSGPLLMSMKDAYRYLGVGRVTLWRMIKAGKVRTVEILPNSRRILKADLDNIVGYDS